MAWLLLLPFVVVLGACALGVLAERRATRRLEEETRRRHAREGIDGIADVDPEDVLRALGELLDVQGIAAIYQEKDSNVVYVLAAAWVSERGFRALREEIRFAIPIGLSARVVRSREDIPETCVICAKGWAA